MRASPETVVDYNLELNSVCPCITSKNDARPMSVMPHRLPLAHRHGTLFRTSHDSMVDKKGAEKYPSIAFPPTAISTFAGQQLPANKAAAHLIATGQQMKSAIQNPPYKTYSKGFIVGRQCAVSSDHSKINFL